LKETAPNLQHPFICCLTSYDEEELKKEALSAGMNSFAIKPIFKSGIQQLLI
jgi:CheY-like chemotaxis protein